jgi:microcystin-dependent protein
MPGGRIAGVDLLHDRSDAMTDHPSSPPGSSARAGRGDLPVGSVTAFAGQVGAAAAGATTPIEAHGWMLCDGRSLPIAQYPELFAALGHLYGGSDATFRIPDYRGYFLRGVDDGRGMDPDASARRQAPQGEPRGIGSTQDCALQAHEHHYDTPVAGPVGTAPGTTPGLTTPPHPETTRGGPVPDRRSSTPIRTSAAETRPANIYVNYIIKFMA